MSNPLKEIGRGLKKVGKEIDRGVRRVGDEIERGVDKMGGWEKVLTVAAVATVAWFAAPALAGAMGFGGATAGAGAAGTAATAGTAGLGVAGGAGTSAGLTGAIAASGSGATAAAASSAGAGLLGGAAKAAGGFFSNPLVQGQLISTGGQILAGAMSPEQEGPESAYDQTKGQLQATQEMNNVPVSTGPAPRYNGPPQVGVSEYQPAAAMPSVGFQGQPQGILAPKPGMQAENPQAGQARAGLIGRVNPQTGKWGPA